MRINLVPALDELTVRMGSQGYRVADPGPTLRGCRQAGEESWHAVRCHMEWGQHGRCPQGIILASCSSYVSGLNATKNMDSATDEL